MTTRKDSRAIIVIALALSITLPANAGPASAHGPDPLLGTTPWGQDQVVPYTWAANQIPPSWLATAIDQGAADSNASRGARAATYTRQSSAPSKIAYGGSVPCSSYGIACMNRTGVPDYFLGMWFRPHGAVLDWGTLKWCQAQSTPTTGCYDARRVALDEFGHIEMLDHHVNYSDESDYLDAIVQFAGRSKPKEGWDYHAYGRCDVARLQLEYELQTASSPLSTCLSLATSLVIGTTSAYVSPGSSTKLTGALEIAVSSGAKRLSGDPLSRRSVKVQRREPGGTTWANVGTMSVASGEGNYVLTIWPSSTGDYRLFYDAPTSEGLRDSTSGVLTVTVMVMCSGQLSKPSQIAPNGACL